MFFSVKSAVKIAGKVYVPCVCYALPEALKPTLEKMVKEGKAYIYDHKVAFQNGKVIEKDINNFVFITNIGMFSIKELYNINHIKLYF